jgi:hypothetical protein
MTQNADPLATLARIEAAQAALARLLRSATPARLAERPPSGNWSPLENVRHLIFAEQHHFAPSLPSGFRWSTVGVPPPNRRGERRLNSVGSDPATTLDEVLDAWARVHAVVRARCVEAPDELAQKLDGNLNHLVVHTATIEALLLAVAHD